MQYNYFNIDVLITVNDEITFSAVKSIRIENTIEKFSDIAKIEIPREFKSNDLAIAGKNIFDFIKTGYTIKIELGYNGDLTTEFEGYIDIIHADIPLLLECEDEMFKLKKLPKINKTFPSVTLEKLMQFIAPGYQVEALDMPLGKFTIENATPYKVIEELKSKYGIRCYFKNKVLVAGLTIDFKPATQHQFVFNKNIRNTSSLKYVTKEQRKRFYKGISLQKGTSKKITYEFGDQDGDHRTLHLPLNLNLKEVKDWVHKFYESNVYNGYEGSIDSWGIPKTKAGDTAELIDPNYDDGYRDMILFIESVTISVNGSDGFKRENKLSFKIR